MTKMGSGSTCVKDCAMTLRGFSPSCAGCFQTVAQCGMDNCKWSCLGGLSERCKSCIQQECSDNFDTCTGFAVGFLEVAEAAKSARGWFGSNDNTPAVQPVTL